MSDNCQLYCTGSSNIENQKKLEAQWFPISIKNEKLLEKLEEYASRKRGKKTEKKQKNKEILRKKFRHLRQNIPALDREIFSQKICKNLSEIFSQKKISEKTYIALFAGTKEEPDIVEKANLLSLPERFPEKKFCFPKISADKSRMDFFEVSTQNDLQKGAFGILQPQNFCKKIDPENIQIFCIPAVSIDTDGFRLGMGGGYYDKYLSQFSKISEKEKQIIKIGIIFSCQISKNPLPREEFDIPVDIILTEEGRIIFSQNLKPQFLVD